MHRGAGAEELLANIPVILTDVLVSQVVARTVPYGSKPGGAGDGLYTQVHAFVAT